MQLITPIRPPFITIPVSLRNQFWLAPTVHKGGTCTEYFQVRFRYRYLARNVDDLPLFSYFPVKSSNDYNKSYLYMFLYINFITEPTLTKQHHVSIQKQKKICTSSLVDRNIVDMRIRERERERYTQTKMNIVTSNVLL